MRQPGKQTQHDLYFRARTGASAPRTIRGADGAGGADGIWEDDGGGMVSAVAGARRGGDLCARERLFRQRTAVLGRALPRAGTGGLRGAGRIPLPGGRGGRGLFLELACRTLAGERECVLFLDDFHLLRDRRAAELLCEFARCAPPNVHVIAASRDRFLPGEEVFRLGGRLLQLGKDDLRLNRTELNIYARRCGLDLTEAQTERLEQTCEGWFSAVYLNLRALHEQGALLTEGTDIYEMFTAALLAPLEEDKRLLLAVMSQADEFTAEMARAVTGAGRRAGAAA